MRTIVVSAVNIRKGGTLTVLRECLEYLSGLAGEFRVVALVHDRSLCEYTGVEYVEMPWCTRSWFHRLWAEYVTMHGLSRTLVPEGEKVCLWLSLHDSTPRVEAEHQAVYCHTSFPFMKVHAVDFLMDAKIPLFALLTKFVYRMNVRRNDWLVVQQDWFRNALSAVTGYTSGRIIVAPPAFRILEYEAAVPADGMPLFVYPSTPDCHKNFELVCRAADIAERIAGKGKFRVVLTIDGTENRYSRRVFRKWGRVESVDFAGLMPRDRLFSLYSEASCLIFPSRTESWGLPISEFLPSGKPMLLADLPYAHETAAGAAKVAFFDPENAEDLASHMLELISGNLSSFRPVPGTKPSAPQANDWDALFKILLKE